jgi:alkylation response protein AidB-like acyl-CoA dehydrogenase
VTAGIAAEREGWAGPLAEDRFRAAFGAFLDEHDPGRPPRDRAERLVFERRWAGVLADHGWAGPAWPRRWGGMELPLPLQAAYHDIVASRQVPAHPSPHAFMVGPTIIAHGNADQQHRFLLPTLRADILWCQGFSEPEAGSDLASLRTRAVRDGDDYLVRGEKVWTSRADTSEWMFALVRTGSQADGAAGISYLLIDLATPGISIRPLRDMTGGRRFTQVLFDGARVPAANRVGPENGGWPLARTTLGHERSTSRVAAILRYRRVIRELVTLAAERGASRDPRLRQQLAGLVADCEVLVVTAQRIVAEAASDTEPGPASSVFRLAHAQFEQRLHEVAVQVLGMAAVLGPDDPASPQGGRWTWGFLSTRASTIGAGTAEIQRDTIAERWLGLPR